jgi:ParB-like chromosome segregation protein Spo0J
MLTSDGNETETMAGKKKKRDDASPTMQPVRLGDIKRAAYNPRKALKPGDPEYEKLAKSIETFGLVEPLVWNKKTGNLVGGHQRLTVLTQLRGLSDDDTIEVSVVNLSLEQEKALNVALNNIAGQWDETALASLMTELQAAEIDATLTGYDDAEIAAMLGELEAQEPIPEPTPAELYVVVAVGNKKEQASLQRSLSRRGYNARSETR